MCEKPERRVARSRAGVKNQPPHLLILGVELGALRARQIARAEPERAVGSGADLEPGQPIEQLVGERVLGKDHRRAGGSLARNRLGRGAARPVEAPWGTSSHLAIRDSPGSSRLLAALR